MSSLWFYRAWGLGFWGLRHAVGRSGGQPVGSDGPFKPQESDGIAMTGGDCYCNPELGGTVFLGNSKESLACLPG